MKKSENLEKTIIKRFKRKLGLISDMHVGSYYAIFPEDFKLEAGNVVKLNEGQQKLLGYWQNFKAVCDELQIDTFLFGGDMIHGQNPKGKGIGLITTNLNEQKEAASILISPILKDRKSYWVAGSDYHASTPGHNPDESLCRFLNEKKDLHAEWLGPVANLRAGKKLLNLSHGGSGAFIYRETSMAREIMFSKTAYANDKLPKIDMFIHGHWHWFAYLHEYDVHFVQLPCWIAYEPISLYTKNYTRFQPDIGAAICLIDDEERITVWHFLYPLPHIADEEIKI